MFHREVFHSWDTQFFISNQCIYLKSCNVMMSISTHGRKHFWISLRKKCPYSVLFWSAFFHIWTEYGEIQSISPYSVQMRWDADQYNSEYGHFSRSVYYLWIRNYLVIKLGQLIKVQSWTIFMKYFAWFGELGPKFKLFSLLTSQLTKNYLW